MRVLGVLFFFLYLGGLLNLSEENLSIPNDFSVSPAGVNSPSDLSFQESSSFDIGEALPTSFVPERPVVRSSQFFFAGQSALENNSGLAEIFQTIENNYLKLSLTIDTNFPAFLIVFPHHNFT